MSKKFDKFKVLCEKAHSHYANGGFRTNTPVKLRPEFFESEFYKKHYQANSPFDAWLRGSIKENPDLYFFIHDVAGNSNNANAKDANELAGSGDIILTLKCDPRTLSNPTEFNEFIVPGDYRLIEVLNFGVNLPPVQGVPNKYENYGSYAQVKPVPVNVDDFKALDNHSIDGKLPVKQTAIPVSTAKEKRYAKPTKKSFLSTKRNKRS
jgi:hypothetical protein